MVNNLNTLAMKNCKDAGAGTVALTPQQVESYLPDFPGWAVLGNEMVNTYRFENYHQTIAFVNAIAWISHRQDHHPDLKVTYNRVEVRYTTHSAGGLSELDFICAAKVEMLFSL